MPSLFDRLKESCAADWAAYTGHPFVEALGRGTLPAAAFRHYLQQDYLFLIDFARAYALAGYKARDLADLTRAKDGMAAILNTELRLHADYCGQWGISEADLAALEPDLPTLAYTRYVLERGMAGALLDLHVALAPCMLGYAEIGATLARTPTGTAPDNPYRAWVEMYASPEFQDSAAEQAAYIDALAGTVSDSRFAELARTFGHATRLEIGFWQMGLDAGRNTPGGP